jgi:hypothetical protein
MRETSGEKILIFEGVVRKLSHAKIEIFKFLNIFYSLKFMKIRKKLK